VAREPFARRRGTAEVAIPQFYVKLNTAIRDMKGNSGNRRAGYATNNPPQIRYVHQRRTP
jgi:hypothetical protein